MSCATQRGFNRARLLPGVLGLTRRGRESRTGPTRPIAPPRLLPYSVAAGVGHCSTAAASIFPWPSAMLGCIFRVRCSFSLDRGVGHSDDKDARAFMRGTDVTSTHHERPAGVAERFQVTEDGICAATAQSRHVFDEHPPWAEFTEDPGKLAPESAPLPAEPDAFARCGDVLAGEAAGDEIDALKGLSPGKSYVAPTVDVRPMSGEDGLTVGLPLDLPAHGKARALEPERHAPNAREEVAACHDRPRCGHTSAWRHHRPHRKQ